MEYIFCCMLSKHYSLRLYSIDVLAMFMCVEVDRRNLDMRVVYESPGTWEYKKSD
jgi:hypothetical protein